MVRVIADYIKDTERFDPSNYKDFPTAAEKAKMIKENS
tara:strand:+ start:298 stop:411 length:114 start_codon:yes stop_codon:yes gene_type:complete